MLVLTCIFSSTVKNIRQQVDSSKLPHCTKYGKWVNIIAGFGNRGDRRLDNKVGDMLSSIKISLQNERYQFDVDWITLISCCLVGIIHWLRDSLFWWCRLLWGFLRGDVANPGDTLPCPMTKRWTKRHWIWRNSRLFHGHDHDPEMSWETFRHVGLIGVHHFWLLFSWSFFQIKLLFYISLPSPVGNNFDKVTSVAIIPTFI